MKKFIGFIICFIFCFIFLVSCGDDSNNSGRLIDSARTIKVVQIEGTATVTDDNETIDCFKGMNLYDGDILNVSKDSILVVKFDEDKYVYLGENTKVNIKSEGKDSYKTNIFVETGKVLAEIQNVLGQDEEFFLSSNNSVMAVRGTIFGVTVIDIGSVLKEIYSVFKGSTEFYVFDTDGDKTISGKLTNVNNQKIEVVVPKDKIVDNDKITENWLKDIDNQYKNPEDANENLDEVQITVDKPSKEDYQQVNELIKDNGSTVSYSNIKYEAESYVGPYDGNSHSIKVNVETAGAKITYKDSLNGTYSENLPTFKLPGSYRVYFKISCDGFDDKEDYGVVQISKADLTVEYKNNITVPGLITGMSVNKALEQFNIFDYIDIKGVSTDDAEILKATFDSNEYLKIGTNSYNINVILPDSIKDLYNDTVLDISLDASEIRLQSTSLINSGYLYVDEASMFNKYNGIAETELFGNPSIYVGDVEITGYESIDFAYNYKTEGYYEVKPGFNEVEIVVHFDDFELNTNVSFYCFDNRDEDYINIYTDDNLVSEWAEDCYYFNTTNIEVSNNKYQIPSTLLASRLGLDDFEGFINLPTDVLDSDSINYYVSDSYILQFDVDDTSYVELLIYPTSSRTGCIKTISVYFSETHPTNYPSYEVAKNIAFLPGANVDFITSESPVKYSLDGINYQDHLSFSELGEYEVYFKVGDSFVAKGIRTVLITTGTITSANLELISNNLYMISNDNMSLMYRYSSSEFDNVQDIVSSDGTTITSKDDLYEIYTNIIKNSKYYNSMTNEELDVTVYVSEKEENSADFSYEVIADGYVSLKGNVEFGYSNIVYYTPKEGYSGDIEIFNFDNLSVVNPLDKTVSKKDIDDVYASRIVFTLEDKDDYEPEIEVLYSIDEGKTWVDETPVLTEVGEYDVYIIYKIQYEYDTETRIKSIVAKQHITITE